MNFLQNAFQFAEREHRKGVGKEKWKIGSQKGFCLNLAFQALEDQTSKLRDSDFMKEMQKSKVEKEKESEKVQRMAEEIASDLDGLSEGHSRKSRSINIVLRYQYNSILLLELPIFTMRKYFSSVSYLFSQFLRAGILC